MKAVTDSGYEKEEDSEKDTRKGASYNMKHMTRNSAGAFRPDRAQPAHVNLKLYLTFCKHVHPTRNPNAVIG